MSNSKWKKALSLVLVLVLIFQMMPVSVFAEEIRKLEDENIIVIGDEGNAQEADPGEYSADDVLWEIESKRTETEKHFRMRGGTNLAVSYAYPVHYLDEDGIYREIDNTLVLYNADGTLSNEPVTSGLLTSNDEPTNDAPESSYEDEPIITIGGSEEDDTVPMQEDEESAVIIIGRDTSLDIDQTAGIKNTNAVIVIGGDEPESSEPENQVDSSGGIIIVQDQEEAELSSDDSDEENSVVILGEPSVDENASDTTITDELTSEDAFQIDTRVYKNAAGLADISLAVSGGAGQLATISYGGYSVSLTPQTSSSSSMDGTAANTSRRQAQIAGQIRQLESVVAPNCFQAKITPQNLNSALIYENLFDQADLEYIVAESFLKENIIVNARASSYTYSFLLDPDGLTPVQLETGSIELRDANGKAIFTIPAGYMFDANGNSSMEVDYDLEPVKNGKFILTVTGDADWINDESRALPVTIDPPLYMTGFFNLETGTLNERYPNGAGGQVATESLGYYSATGKNCRMLVRVNNLPEIPDNSYVVNSGIYLYEVAYSEINMSSLRIQAQALTYNSPTEGYWCLYHTWNDCPTLSSEVIDYVDVSNSSAFYGWNITREAIGWYNDPSTNYGICLKATKEGSMNSSSCANVGFASSNTSNAGARPYFVVEYRNNVGLENYYTYQSHDIDRAGIGYIGDYSGQLTIAKNDVSAASTINPVDISHVYNSAYSANDYTAAILNADSKYANMKLGKGWMLNIQQSISEYNSSYILYADGDGTIHFFALTATDTYKDEDGLGLTITKSGSNYTLTDRKNNICYFTDGMLSYIQDANGNKVNYVRNSSNQVTSVTRQNNGASSETIATLSYNSSGYLTSITDCANNTTSYTYDSSNRLTTITHADGTTISYTYNGNSKLASATDNESGYSMNYEYNTQTGKVSKFYEKGGSTTGIIIGVDGSYNGVQSYRYSGNDRTADNDDDIITSRVFDYYGRTISSYSTSADKGTLYGASSTQYVANSGTSGTNNRALVDGNIGIQAENFASDGSIEAQSSINSSSSPWSISGAGTASISSSKAHTGNKSLSVTRTATQGESIFSQTISGLTASEWYVISAYVNTEAVTNDGEAYILSGDYKGTPVTWSTADFGDGWERIYAVAQADSSGSLEFKAIAKGFSGTVYFDDFQAEPTPPDAVYIKNMAEEVYAPSSANLLVNGNMVGNTGWSFSNSNLISYQSDSTFGRVIKVSGNSYSSLNASQTVNINLPATQTYIYSGWAKAASTPLTGSRTFGLYAIIKYTDGTTETQSTPFSADSTQWQYTIVPIVPTSTNKTVQSIEVKFQFDNNPNTAYFANASLTREETQSYKYNANGDLVSVSVPDNETQTFSYSGADLIGHNTQGCGTYSYEYDSKHNVTKISNDNVSMAISYDAKGNTSGTTLSATGTDAKITTSAAYNTSGNLLTSQTDARGNSTTYSYTNSINQLTGQASAVTDANSVTKNMTYNAANGRIMSESIADTVSIDYSYTAGKVSSISRTSHTPRSSTNTTQTVDMNYDSFGNRTRLRIGLVLDYGYDYVYYPAGNGHLVAVNTDDGCYYTYNYDRLDRLIQVSYNDQAKQVYGYTANGNIGKITDHQSGHVNNYSYDALDRLTSMTEYNGDVGIQSLRNAYDTANRITKVQYKLSPAWDGSFGTVREYNYSYNKDTSGNDIDGSLISLSAPGASFSYSYDGLKRLESRVMTVGNSTLIDRQYSYLPGTGANNTTLLVSGLVNESASGTAISQFYYEYDALGNITKIWDKENPGSNDQPIATYSYDSLGQLTAETVAGRSYAYSYDTAGNLLSKSETINGTTTTDTLTYDTGAWKDRVASINGQSIPYYNMGRPETWRDGIGLSWGLFTGYLASATCGDTTASYTYASDGLRLTKTIGDVEHKYIWQGSKLVSEAYDGKELEFFYDESGSPYAFSYKASATASPVIYYYVTNLQGDVVSIIDSSGASKAEYVYNAWGEIISATGAMAGINPLRYRGYYYDTETGFYYCKSRYYDPELCRFISFDSVAVTGQGFTGSNMFVYCLNNPVNRTDDCGDLSIYAASAIVGFAVGGISQIATNVMQGKQWSDGVLGAAIGGAAYNVASIFVGVVAAGYISAATESIINEAFSYFEPEKQWTADNARKSMVKVFADTAVNGSIYAITGKGANKIIPFNPKLAEYGVGSLIHGKIMQKMWGQSAVQAALVLGQKILRAAFVSPSTT